MNKGQKHLVAGALAAAIAFPLALAAFTNGVLLRPVVRLSWHRRADASTYVPAASDSSGVEIVLVLITSPTCAWCNDPDLPRLIEKAKIDLYASAAESGHTFAAIGIAQSRAVGEGIEHLQRFGQFDEVSAGRRWLNGGLQKFVYSEHLGPAATPQVIILARSIEVDPRGRRFRGERVLARKIGLWHIARWVARGSEVPLHRPHDKAAGNVDQGTS